MRLSASSSSRWTTLGSTTIRRVRPAPSTSRLGGLHLMRVLRPLLIALAACGGGKVASCVVVGVLCDGLGSGNSLPTQTDVAGSIGGAAFDLRYSAVHWSPQGDPRTWVCVANVPITYAQCMQSGGADRIMLLGPFTYDQSGAPRWDVAELFLSRIGANPTTDLARYGTIAVFEDDSTSSTLKVSFTKNNKETQPATKTVVTP